MSGEVIGHIRRVTRLAAARADADERLRAAVREAHVAGVSPTELAHAAGIGRQTVYRWLRD